VARSRRWKGAWRAIAYTLAISIAFVLLQRSEIAFFDRRAGSGWVVNSGLADRNSAADLAREAGRVAEDSRAALERLPPAIRRAAFRLGYNLAYAAELSGSLLMSAPESRERARPIIERRVAAARDLARAMQLGDVAMLPVSSLSDFGALNQRIDDDENGVAVRVERQLSPLHRHLYLLGAHLGTEGARVESTGGELFAPEMLRIRRHATLAGVPDALWRAVGSAKADASVQTVDRFHAAVDAIDTSLAP
jgi:hypothetical protein